MFNASFDQYGEIGCWLLPLRLTLGKLWVSRNKQTLRTPWADKSLFELVCVLGGVVTSWDRMLPWLWEGNLEKNSLHSSCLSIPLALGQSLPAFTVEIFTVQDFWSRDQFMTVQKPCWSEELGKSGWASHAHASCFLSLQPPWLVDDNPESASSQWFFSQVWQ